MAKSPPPSEALMTIRNVAAHVQVSERTIARLVDAGALRAVRIGRTIRFRPADVRDAFRPE